MPRPGQQNQKPSVISSRPGLRSRVSSRERPLKHHSPLTELHSFATQEITAHTRRGQQSNKKNGLSTTSQTPRLHPSRSRPPSRPQKLPAQPPGVARQRVAELQRRRAACRRRAELQASRRQRWEAREATVCVLGVDGHAFADAQSGA